MEKPTPRPDGTAEPAPEPKAAPAPPAPAPTPAPVPEVPARKAEAPSATPQLPRWPPAGGLSGGGGQSATFASSIKALHLEPMRASPHQARPKPPLRPQGQSELQASAPHFPAPLPQQAPQAQQPPQPQQPQPVPQPVPQPQPQPPQQQPHPQPQPQPSPQPSPQPPHTQPGAREKKGFKVKNAAMARPSKPRGEDDEEERPTPAPEEPRKEQVEAPRMEVALPEAPPPREEPKEREAPREPPAVAVAVPVEAPRRDSLKPRDGIFDRTLMLRIWRTQRAIVHPMVASLGTNQRPGEKGTPVAHKRGPQGRHPHEPADRQVFGTDMKTKSRKEPQLKVSEKGYRPIEATAPLRREDELERKVRCLLNKICPDNLKIIVEHLALIELYKAEELEFVIRIIFSKALAEPHYCETYADMVFALRTRYPEFPPESEGEKPATFTRVLLNTCQNEFENLPSTFEPTDEERRRCSQQELNLEMKRRKDKMLANMKFIGNLFLRQLLAVKVIGQVVHDLIVFKDSLPEEHMIECVCELLHSIGYTLDGTTHGKLLMSQFSARLVDLKRTSGPDGKGTFSKRIQFQIQDLLDLRANGWQKKLFKEQAKTKQDIRRDAINDQRQQAKGAEVMFSTTTAGMRPSYIDEFKTAKPPRAKMQDSTAKPVFDQAFVRRMFQYYAEEKNGEALEQEWNRASPSPKEAKQGVEWLLEVGFNDAQKEDVVAETVTELVLRRVVAWDLLRDVLGVYLEGLEDMRMDVPQADIFFHSLLSRLLLATGNHFNPTILRPLPLEHSGEFSWGLLVGALQKVKARGGANAVREALAIQALSEAACKARKCAGQELKRHLSEEGVL